METTRTFRDNQLVCKECGVTAVTKKGKLVHRYGGYKKIVTCKKPIAATVKRFEFENKQ